MSPRTTLGMVSPILYFPAAYTQMTSSEILNLENKSYLQETKNYQKESSPNFPGRPVQAERALYIIFIWLTSEYSFTVYNNIGTICRLNLGLEKHR